MALLGVALLGVALLSCVARPLGAQLISPGKLSRAHADLEGIKNCTQCHELRHSGISPALCLGCHKPLAGRIAAGQGFHGSLTEKNCAVCHREHFGADFDLVRLDTASFDHRHTGWPLDGKHASSSCRECHRADFVTDPDVRAFASGHGTLDRTFLGLSKECRTCHAADSPHESQFAGRSCAGCHVTAGWKDVSGFDHGKTAFALAGAHATVKCAECHTTTPRPGRAPLVRYQGVSTDCSTCHGDDSPHGAQFAGRSCGACHDARGWKGASAFDHGTARFPLTGLHRKVRCAQCHAPIPRPGAPSFVRYRGVVFTSCKDCHEDAHHGGMTQACARCHTTDGWGVLDRSRVETSFDHATTGFILKGRHADIACASCHDAKLARSLKGVHLEFEPGTETHTFPSPRAATCTACHDDAHQGVFQARADSGACQACHRETGWVPATFDVSRHDGETDFPLEGAHVAVPCQSCHGKSGTGPPTFRLGAVTCRSCHEATSPHGDQFAKRACAECHDVRSFHIAAFDHSKTRFPLEGAHSTAPCSACHHTEPGKGGSLMVRYRPLGTECSDCHGGRR